MGQSERREDLLEEVTFEQSPEGGSHGDVWGRRAALAGGRACAEALRLDHA